MQSIDKNPKFLNSLEKKNKTPKFLREKRTNTYSLEK